MIDKIKQINKMDKQKVADVIAEVIDMCEDNTKELVTLEDKLDKMEENVNELTKNVSELKEVVTELLLLGDKVNQLEKLLD